LTTILLFSYSIINIRKNQLIYSIFLEANPALRYAFLAACVFLFTCKIVSVGHSFAATKTTQPSQKELLFGLG